MIRNVWVLGQLLRDAYRPRTAVATLQADRLKRVLVDAAQSVPHYREAMYRIGYDPRRDFRGVGDLAQLPITTKDALKDDPAAFVHEAEAQRLATHFSDRTSGSTGVPVTVYRSPQERAVQVGKWLRVLMLNGYRPTDKVLSYTSPARLNEERSPLRHLGLLRRRAVDFTLAPAAGADALLDYRPDVIYGNRTSLALVAEELIERGVSPAPLKFVVATGEIIDDAFKQICRQAFGVGVTETYGSVEMGVMAYQQGEQEGLHLIEDCTFFEFLDDQGNPVGPGQPTRVVVTNLFGRLMPLIRYDQGDHAVYSLRPGPDGHPVRVIDRIIGRQDDLATLADGKVLTWLDFYQARHLLAEAKRFRITQRAVDDFLVEIVTSREHLQMIEAELRTRLGKLSQLPLRFELRIVGRINPDTNGKMRLLVSKVPRSSPVK